MKKLFILFTVTFISLQTFSQSITVSFTGKNTNDDYVKTDSVIIIDLEKNWAHTLVYPDTSFDLLSVGINHYNYQENEFLLSQNTPNPFSGTTDFSLTITETENISIEIHDILGKTIASYSNVLYAGIHTFTVNVGIPQMYFLTAKSKNKIVSIKMVNTLNTGGEASIRYKNSDIVERPTRKATQTKEFTAGDSMQYVAYYNGIYTNIVQPQTASQDFTFTFDPSIYVTKTPENRTVLIEEFTGTNCGYCPDGHRRSDSLVAIYPGIIYTVNIHAGSFAAYYKTNVGTLLNNYFYVSSYPAGIVSREVVDVGGTYKYPISRGAWGDVAGQIFKRPSYVNIAAKTAIDTVTRKLTCNVQAYFTNKSTAANGKNYIHIAILQDNIWGPQSNGKTFYPEKWNDSLGKYQHNHMLRELILGVDGENMGGISQGTTYQKTFTYDIPLKISNENMVLEDLYVLVFITEGEPSNIDEYKNNKERVIYVTKSELVLTKEE
ncbi:MAG TPA: Omp28-related outer membrane protein [Bacteroidales bacterium]|nr:Omp28-related outer membrane protein [Bacteroidales bacterium]HPJ92137.1 Omp28-related outer membrane protein [Bacteroidales bacterium]